MLKRFQVCTFILCFCLSCADSDYLDGYNRDALFAQPSQSELDAVVADWESRDLSPQNYRVEQTIEVLSNSAVLKIVSFTVNGFKEYGALLIPNSSTTMPVRMLIGGFGIQNTINSVSLVINEAFFENPFIFAFPSLRGQSLSITLNGAEYTSPISEGIHCDAFDQATDDAIAFLNVIEYTENMADVNRVGVRGGSRGGTVALLMGERDKRVKLAIDIAGPTNMIGLTSENENDLTYQCQFLENLVNGSATVSDVRHKMIASSPIFFAENLPKTQLHLAANDVIVPVNQGDQLKEIINDLGMSGEFEMYVYEGRDHSTIASNNSELNSRIEQFLSQL